MGKQAAESTQRAEEEKHPRCVLLFYPRGTRLRIEGEGDKNVAQVYFLLVHLRFILISSVVVFIQDSFDRASAFSQRAIALSNSSNDLPYRRSNWTEWEAIL